MSVQRTRIEQPAVVALGSNLGDRAATIRSALDALAASDGVTVVAVSSLIETPAVKLRDGRAVVDPAAPAYLNAVARIRTTLTPQALLHELQRIEQEHGRVRAERWGDRTLDVDLVDVAGIRSDSPELTLPHPRAHEREFVLRPWLEIDSDAVVAGHGRVADLLAAVTS